MRAARPDDLAALYQMAKGTGGGFTNLPADRATLKTKLERADASFARDADTPADDLFLFILEDAESGQAKGTCQIFAQVGSNMPFYSYRVSTMTQVSQELGRTFRAEMLTLSTDLDGSSEVGGLWLAPHERSAGAGALLARGRYLFMKLHRARFADRTIAELRGAHDDTGGSPFWDALAGRFFGMSFHEADAFNAMHGNQFIADLMPKHPIYTAMLPESALAVIGKPHKTGLPAMRMLEKEGFAYQGYIDIFDGGPTMAAPTDAIATVVHAQVAPLTGIAPAGEGVPSLVAHGRLGEFRACCGVVSASADGVVLDEEAACLLGVSPGNSVTHVPR